MGDIGLKIHSLIIRRYKSIEQLEMPRLNQLNVLVGENGSGKTNILELLLMFFKEYNRIGSSTSQLSPEHWYKREQTKSIEINMDLELNQQELVRVFGKHVARFVNLYLNIHGYISVSASLSSSNQWGGSIFLGNLPLHVEGTQMNLEDFLNEIGYKISFDFMYFVQPQNDNEKQWALSEGVPYVLDDQRKEVHRIDLGLIPYIKSDANIELGISLDEWLKKESFTNSNGLSLVEYQIRSVNQNLDALNEIIRESLVVVQNVSQPPLSPVRTGYIPPNELQEILSFEGSQDGQKQAIWFKFKENFERVFGGSLIRVDNEIQYVFGQRRYSLSSVGGGHASWFRLLWQISQNRDKILLLEEPESHMHSRLAKSVGLFLHEAAKVNQIFFTTHSTVFLDQCSYSEIWLVKHHEVKGTTAQRMENFESLRDIAFMLGIEPSDILYSNYLLFLEGVADMSYIQVAAKLMNIKLFPTRVGIIPFEGIGKGRFHLEVFREAAIKAGTPFFVLLDGDEDAIKKKEELVNAGLVTEEQILNLERRDIENYYPEDLFYQALDELYHFNEQEAQTIQKAIRSKNCTKQIDKVLHETRELSNGVWKKPVAEYISAKIGIEHIDPDLKSHITRIDSYFIQKDKEREISFE